MTSAFAPQPEFLRLTRLHAFYGESHILHGIDLSVAKGECVTLLGRNGAGRTTTLKAIMGMVGRRTGSIMLNGNEIINVPTHRIARHGVGYCPEERAIFASLSAEENLTMAPIVASGGKCWRWRASCVRAPSSCFSTKSPKAWPR
jgi:branched-chain amino acid transport system ATP-binding protein